MAEGVTKPGARPIAAVRGGGDIATGVVQALWRAGFLVCILEAETPLTIRRTVSLGTAATEGEATVEDMQSVRVQAPAACPAVWEKDAIPLLVDPAAASLPALQPAVLVDAIIAKKNLGTHRAMAPVTIGLGPGFAAPKDVDAVVETMRGHSLGRIITKGCALPNTGIPGELGGKTWERVVYAPAVGTVRHACAIGDEVTQGDVLFYVDATPATAPLSGVVRGLIAAGTTVPRGLKCADVDPRTTAEVDCFTISDKARALGGAALTAALYVARQKGLGGFAGPGEPPTP